MFFSHDILWCLCNYINFEWLVGQKYIDRLWSVQIKISSILKTNKQALPCFLVVCVCLCVCVCVLVCVREGIAFFSYLFVKGSQYHAHCHSLKYVISNIMRARAHTHT